jgi:SAM-dependent methyltransferase
MLFNSLDKNDFKILKEIGKKLIKVKPIKIKMNLKYKQDQIRYQKTRALCKGRVLHLGSSENDGDSALQNLIKKKFEAYSVDLENADYLQNLNEKEWKIPGTFDTVLALEIIEHIENPTQFIRNCCKLLKKGGRLILSTPNATGLIYLKNPGWMVNYKGNSYKEDWGHIHTFTPNMLKLLMENSGVKFKGKYYINAFIFNPLNYLMAKLFPRLRGDILIWGDKP